ncbi:AbrB/MazE/SpoVT family DNA-binding domain-containing protein [Micromonospora sicca]|nr:AbrB/MazE/SpoVT family DNA-binding domain-containing protein [Micromonospora sp. 4G51]
MTPTASTDVMTPATVDNRRRVRLPAGLADVAGLHPGAVVVLPGAAPGELVLATPAAALARLRRDLAEALRLADHYPTLTAALTGHTTGRAAVPPAADGPAPAAIPAGGPVLVDTAVLTAVLDGEPAADTVIPLLPRLQLTDAVTDDLIAAAHAAGLPAEPQPDRPGSFRAILTALDALGVRNYRPADADRAALVVRDFELRTAGVTCPAERAVLALAGHLGAPALLARPATALPAGVTAIDYRHLAAVGASA